MLVITGVIEQVGLILNQISKLNPTFLQFPFTLKTSRNPQNGSAAPTSEESITYKFESNLANIQSHWFFQSLIIVTAMVFSVYQVLYEDTFVDMSMHLLGIALGVLVIAFMYNQHSEVHTNFLNKLLMFERRCQPLFDFSVEQRYWRSNDSRNRLVFLIKLFRTLLPIEIILFPLSVAILPYSPWRMVPAAVLDSFSIFNFGGTAGILLTEVMKRIVSFGQFYLVFYLGFCRCIIVVTIFILAEQGAIMFLLLSFRRIIAKDSSTVCKTERWKQAVLMYRGIQLICDGYNDIQKGFSIPVLILTSVVANTIALFILLYNFPGKTLQTVALFASVLLVWCCVVLFAFKLAVSLYEQSTNLLMPCSWRYDKVTSYLSNGRNSATVKKHSQSLSVLKIYCYKSNYFEGNTPLNILGFSIDCAIYLILCGV